MAQRFARDASERRTSATSGILVHDGGEYKEERDEANHVYPRADRRFLHGLKDSGSPFQEKEAGEGEKKQITRIFPKSQKEEPGQKRSREDRAQEESIQHRSMTLPNQAVEHQCHG